MDNIIYTHIYTCDYILVLGIFRNSCLCPMLEQLMETQKRQFVLYENPAYTSRPLLLRPYMGAKLTGVHQT